MVGMETVGGGVPVSGGGGQGKAWNWRRQSVARRAPRRRMDVGVDFFYLPSVSSGQRDGSSTCLAADDPRVATARKEPLVDASTTDPRRLGNRFCTCHSRVSSLISFLSCVRHVGEEFPGDDETWTLIRRDGLRSADWIACVYLERISSKDLTSRL